MEAAEVLALFSTAGALAASLGLAKLLYTAGIKLWNRTQKAS